MAKKIDKQKKRNRPWGQITCRFCVSFRKINTIDKEKGFLCEATGKWIRPNTKSCHGFDLCQVFACNTHGQAIFIDNCLARRKNVDNKFSEYYLACKKCSDGRSLNWFVNGLNITYNIIEEGENEFK